MSKRIFSFLFPAVDLPPSIIDDEKQKDKKSSKKGRRSHILDNGAKRLVQKDSVPNIDRRDFFDEISESSSRLKTILTDPCLVNDFRKFLETSLSVENLDFWYGRNFFFLDISAILFCHLLIHLSKG